MTATATPEISALSRRADRVDTAERISPGRKTVVPVVIVAAWTTVVVAQFTGTAVALHHHALIEGGPPLWLAIPFFLAGWMVMVAAMMLPASLTTIRSLEVATLTSARPLIARSAFLGSFAAIWAAFGLLAFLGDVVLHRVVDTTPWLADRPWLIEACVLAVAGGYQFAPVKRRSLAACRHPRVLAASAWLREEGSARLGVRHGFACLGSSWALMLLMFAESFASLWWMVGLTAIMTYEATGRHGQRAATAIGVVLLFLALTTLSGPGSARA